MPTIPVIDYDYINAQAENIEVIGDRLLVYYPDRKDVRTPGGILVPAAVMMHADKGSELVYIVKASDGVMDQNGNITPLAVKSGQWAYIHRFEDLPVDGLPDGFAFTWISKIMAVVSVR